ncbi:MAG TPA: hypothetical protein ENK59_01035 [Thioploca sp.]|nr:hypothetical protein [Thioploca sp.]
MYIIRCIFLGLIISGCGNNAGQEITEQAGQISDMAVIEIDNAKDVNSVIKAAKTTIEALNKLSDAIILAPDITTIIPAQEKFEIARFKTVQRLHTFLDSENSNCKNILNILLKLDSKIKSYACEQNKEEDFLGCNPSENATCECTRNSVGTCPNNKECVLLSSGVCQCNKCYAI